jgi:hypothetical protein
MAPHSILDQKKDPLIILSWNPDLSYTDSLHHRKVANTTSTRTKKTPSTKSNDFL